MRQHPYASAAYASSLHHVGEALYVPEWDCHVIVQRVADGADAVGTYPLAILAANADLPAGIERLRRLGLISVTLVLDDFHRPPLDQLRRHFDVVKRFKTHYVRRNALPFAYAKHHRYEVRRAAKTLEVRPFELQSHLAEWSSLYATLAERHGLSGVHDFPLDHFEALAGLGGAASIGAWMNDALVCAHIWVSDGRFVHSHLAASSQDGYAAGAAYAVYDASMVHFQEAELLNLGGAAGASDDALNGLARFKQGFTNEIAAAYLCGAVLDDAKYENLVHDRSVAGDTQFFPAYRARTG